MCAKRKTACKGKAGREEDWYFRGYDLRKFGLPWIVSMGRARFNRCNDPAEMHVHGDDIEILYCVSGSCQYESCGKRYDLTPGKMFVSRPDEPHRQLSNPKGYAYFSLLFHPTASQDVKWFARKLRALPRIVNSGPHVGACFRRAFYGVEHVGKMPETERRIRLQTVMTALLLSIVDSVAYAQSQLPNSAFSALAAEMRNNPGSEYSLADLVARTGLSASTLIEGFKREVGFTPHAYLMNCRIEQAKRDLRLGLPVGVVSDRLSFRTPQHFATAFRKNVGSTPSGWLAWAEKNGG